MDKVLGNKKAIMVFVLPALLLYIGIAVIPMFMSLSYSTLKWNGFGQSVFIGFKNYISLFSDQGFLRSVLNTFILTGLTLLIQLPVALFFALVLAHGVKGEGFFRTVYFIPVVLSSVVIGHLWRRIYDFEFGLLNSVLHGLGLHELTRPWLGDMKTVMIAVCIPIIWQWIGYHMILMYAAAKAIPTEYKEAAKLEGANQFDVALRISIPLMAPVLRICVILAVIGSMKAFDMFYILTGGGPAHASEVPGTLMVNTIFRRSMYGYGSSMSVFIVVECLLLTLAIQRIFKIDKDLTY